MTLPDTRSPIKCALLAGPWLFAAVVATRLITHPFTPEQQSTASTLVAAVCVMIMAGIALLLLPDTTDARRRAVGYAASLLAPFAAVLATQLTGTHSLAFVAACLCALGAVVATGWLGVCIGAAGTLIVCVVAPALAGHPASVGDVGYGVALLITVTVLPLVFLSRAPHRALRGTSTALPSSSAAVIEPTLRFAGVANEPGTSGDAASMESRARTEAIARYLRQVRDTLGVTDVVYWSTTRTDDTLVPAAWSNDDGARWANAHPALMSGPAAVRSVSLLTRLTVPGEGELVAIAVPGAPNTRSVLSLHSTKLSVSHEIAERWLPRFADHLGMLAQLLETQMEYGRQSRQVQSVLQASQAFQQQRTIDALGQSICESALAVTGATRAALVRWYGETSTGVIQCVTSGHHLPAGAPVSTDSLVGQLCIAGLPQVWEDAQLLENVTPVYDKGYAVTRLGGLSVVPFKQGGAVSGAIVVESELAGGVLLRDVRNLRLLAAVAAVSLETVWQHEEATRRARSDALTGLANRRTFDEALARAIAEADRFGHNVGLVKCDVDNFKRVNDLYGRDVGDHVLRSIAASLSSGVRGVDLVARYGGDELVMLLGKADVAMAWEVAERMRATIEAKTIRVGEHLVHVTASFGVASYPETAHAGDELFPAADKALYAAKHEGRNCVRFARPLGSEQADEGEGIPEDGEGEF